MTIKLKKIRATCVIVKLLDTMLKPHEYGISGGTSAFRKAGRKQDAVMKSLENKYSTFVTGNLHSTQNL